MMVHVKVCGITNIEDAVCATDAGADLLGFIFTEKSPRFVDVSRAADIGVRVRKHCASSDSPVPKLVGVYVDAPLEVIQSALRTSIIDYAQLHGDEQPSMLEELEGKAYKALRTRSMDEEAEGALRYASMGVAGGPTLLVDAYSPYAYGGTGEVTDWRSASRISAQVDGFMLAGGLTPENVQAAVDAVHPWAVDVSSGVEAVPGRKDPDAVRAFIKAAHGALTS